MVATPKGEYFYVSGPIKDGDGNLVGVALVGSSVQNLANRARTETLAQITFYDDQGNVLASTLIEPGVVNADEAGQLIALKGESSLTRNMADQGISYNEIISPWEVRGRQEIGLLGVALPPQFLVQAGQFTRENTLLLMVVALLLVVVVGLLVANYISRPLRSLRDAAVQVAGGNLQVKVPTGSRNEVGVLSQSFNSMVSSLYASRKNLLDAYNETIEGWAKATDLRDHETEGHSRRVADLSVALARSMGMSGEDLVSVYRGALLHDIGKIAIPDSILNKKGPLTAAEREQMQKHPEIAMSFMKQIEFLKPALDIPHSHHERWDGSGYPRGLKGKQIPLAARIFAIVDVWDAITSDRPYHQAQGYNATIKQVEAESGKHFDPEVVKAFKKMLGR